jgi:RNA polymerase sigma-70 factor, ECF subfamily
MGQVKLALNDDVGLCDSVADRRFESIEQSSQATFEDWSDRELVSAVVSRDEGAYTELFRRHYRSIVRSSQTILANAAQSEDVGAEVLFDFWLVPEKFDPDRGTLLSYLRVKAKGRSIDIIRSESSRFRRERSDADRNHTSESCVELKVLTAESLIRLRQALTQLPPDEREPIELAFFSGMTYVAVAQHLGLPEGTVKARIRCGLRRLRSACLALDIARGRSLTEDPHGRVMSVGTKGRDDD